MEDKTQQSKATVPTQGGAPVRAYTPRPGGSAPRSGGGSRGGSGRGGAKGPDKRGGSRGGRADRPKPEYDQKSIDVRRVARVVAGGRRFSFSVAMIIGDRKGKVGVGTGKAGDISMAMDKAAKDAKKHMITIKLTKTNSIPHEVRAKASSAIVEIMPSPSRGLVAGSAVRNLLELAGITDVTAKIRSGSKNKLNMARAGIKALSSIRVRTSKETSVIQEN
ncbi:MAG: 30S ribosomal protein S5 [Parcubacteria group bacterium GW2011_GWA2_47_7]|nr:MAG: 30S ribosomal protein S5 [Parcubacteria group bacterium GW2011_GWA2_47_7]